MALKTWEVMIGLKSVVDDALYSDLCVLLRVCMEATVTRNAGVVALLKVTHNGGFGC